MPIIHTAPTRQHELLIDHTDHTDHTDQKSVCPAWHIYIMKWEAMVCPMCALYFLSHVYTISNIVEQRQRYALPCCSLGVTIQGRIEAWIFQGFTGARNKAAKKRLF